MLTRLIKAKTIAGFLKYFYTTRKDFRNKKFSPFDMRNGKAKIRRIENKKFRRDKFNLSNHKKVGVAYRWNIW